MATSLQATLTPQTKVNEFIQEWHTPANADKVLVLVEGKDDKAFYYKFFKADTSVLKDCGGCSKMKDVYPLLQLTSIVNIAIKDSDFARLNGITPMGGNFFYSDAHDYEMMCMSNKSTREDLFDNLAIEYDEMMLDTVSHELAYLSYFKWYNYTFHCNYNFKTFSVEDHSFEELSDYHFIHSVVLPVSPKCRCILKEQLDAFINNHITCDRYELINGHDFIKRLCHHVKRQYPQHCKLNEERVRTILHPCFRLDAFVRTGLYQHIEIWENNNSKNILRK